MRNPENALPASEPSEGLEILRNASKLKLLSLLVACAVLPYANTLLNGFVFDDISQLINNPYVQSFRHLREVFTTTVWSYIGASGATNYYRPMSTLGYMVCYKVFGPHPYGFHLANVVFHAAVVGILFAVTERIFRDRVLAFLAAGLFALHPIHTESVAWIAGVTDLELTFFYLLTFWCFLGLARPGGSRSPLGQLAMAGSFVLTILSKEQALTLPALATVYEHFYRDDRAETTWAQKLLRYGVLWLLGGAYLLFRVHFFGAFAPVKQMSDLTAYQAFVSALALVGQYLGKLLWPFHLSAFYVFQKSTSLLDPYVVLGWSALFLLAALFVALWKRERVASFGFVWLFATLAPVLNARWMAAGVFGERYLYLPSVGFCWLLAWGWMHLWAMDTGRKLARRWALAATLGVVAPLYILRTVTRNFDWQNEVVLYTRTLATSPEAYPIRINLGVAYWAQGDATAAEREWREALKLAPDSEVILNNLGVLLITEKRYPEAVEFFERAIRINPDYARAHQSLGVAYEGAGLSRLAEEQYRAAVALAPLNFQARNLLGKLYLDAGRLSEAEEQFRRSVEIEANVVGLDALGDIYLRRGERPLAERAFQRAVSLNPLDSHAHFNLGALFMESGRKAEAIEEYQAGLREDPSNPEALEALRKLRSQIPDAKLTEP